MKQSLTKFFALLLTLLLVVSTLTVPASFAEDEANAADEAAFGDSSGDDASGKDNADEGDKNGDEDKKGADDEDKKGDGDEDKEGADDEDKKDADAEDKKDDDSKDTTDDKKKDEDKDEQAPKASIITYKGESEKAIELDAADFTDEYKSVTGKTFSRLTFTSIPASSAGVLYYQYDTKNEDKVTKGKSLTKALLADISFVPKKSGTYTATYSITGTSSSDPTMTGTIQFVISEAKGAETISYSGRSNSVIDFSASDFKSVCKTETGKSLDYVKFTLPSSSYGVLYYDYDGREQAKVTKTAKYYAADDPDISLVSFVPKSSYTGTVNINYTGYNTSGKSYTGVVKVKVTSSSVSSSNDDDVDTISYTVTSSKVRFDADDFLDVCEDATDSDLLYIVFTSLPASSAGVLYLGYTSSSRYEDKVSKSEEYYPDDDPDISDISFVPKSGYSGTVTISYRGYYTKSKYYTGKISIRVKSGAGDDDDDDDVAIGTISETLTQNKPLEINASSMSAAFKKASGNKTLSYVKFTLPSSSSGVLYYDYDGDDEAKVKAADKYYASKSPYIKYVTFVPSKNFTGSVTITYTAYASSGSGYTGKLKLTYKASSSNKTGSSKTTATDVNLSYKVKNTPLTLSVTDFNSVSIRATDAAVLWVKLGLVNASAGTMYYNFGKDNQAVLPAGSIVYSDRSPFISEVSFVPKAGYKGDVNIVYTAESIEGDSFSGTLSLKVHSSKKHFRDIAEDSWYADIVNTVCDADLMKGTGEDTFSPEASMTVAEALTMGARLLNQIQGGTDEDFVPSGDLWYTVYVDYAIANGIIRHGDFDDYTREATRAEMAYIFYHSVTLDYLAKINSLTVPDVSADDLFSYEIYGLYDAGILTGNDDAGTFRASSHITRAEAATILGRTGNIVARSKK